MSRLSVGATTVEPLGGSRKTHVVYGAVVIALAAGILSGCTTNVVARSDDFVVVSAGWGDSLSGLADAFLGDPDKHWVIAEFNKIDRVWPGQQVVIPLRANGSTGQHLRQ